MKFTGYKQVRLASIKMDVADIRRRSKEAHVSDLAQSIRENGQEPIQAPTVRVQTKVLVCGRDRMAALTILKSKKVWVRLVECDDIEAQQLERVENVYRRPVDNRAQLLAELVALKEQQIRAQRAESDEGTVSTHPSDRVMPDSKADKDSPRAEARRQVARAAGISPASVKKAEKRAEKAAEGAAAPEAAPVDETPPTLDLLGCDDAGARAIMELARPEQEAIDEADKHLRLAQTALSRFSLAIVQQELKEQVRRVASMVRAARPAAICPWCKGLPNVANCNPCHTLGWVTAEKRDRAPVELREGPPMVAIDGVFYPYADVRDGKLPAKNGKPAKTQKHVRTVLVDEAGGETEFSGDDEQAY